MAKDDVVVLPFIVSFEVRPLPQQMQSGIGLRISSARSQEKADRGQTDNVIYAVDPEKALELGRELIRIAEKMPSPVSPPKPH